MSIKMKIWKTIHYAITSIIVTVIACYAIIVAGGLIFGLKTYAVCSSSMEPTFNVGDLIYVKKVDPSEVRVGDPITFDIGNNMTATHRVIQIDQSNQFFYTKGDNNNDADGTPILFTSLKGIPVFGVAYLGKLTYYIQNPPWKYIAIAVCGILVLVALLPTGKENADNNTRPTIYS